MIIKHCNVSKLHDEFIKAGIQPYPVFQFENGDGDFTFPEGTDMDLVQEIIDNHDPTPLPPIPAKEEVLEQELANTNAMILELAELILGGM